MGDDRSARIKLESGLARLGLEVSAEAVDRLLAYMTLLREWSAAYNLVAPGERDFLLARHVLDSLSVAKHLQPGSILDVGAGAGLPGLPLAIIRPGTQVTLIDSAGKKVRFIRHVGRVLKLGNIHPLHQRVESLRHPGGFSNIVSRAFSSLKGFAEAVRGVAGPGSRLLLMKGAYPARELEELPPWVSLRSVEALSVPYLHAERHVVIMSLSGQAAE